MRKYNDVSLLWKVLFAPLIVLAALVAVAGTAMQQQAVQNDAAHHLNSVIFERLRTAIDLKDETTLFHAEVYALMSSAANETDQGKIGATADALAPRIDALLGRVRAFNEELASASSGNSLADLIAAFDAYAEGARQVIDFVKLDAGYAVMMMGNTNAQFGELRIKLDTLSRALQEQRVATVASVAAGAENARTGFIILIVGGTLLSLFCAVASARAIARPVARLTGVLDALARGDTTVDVPDAGRRDEVGAMAKAVQVFKDNAIDRLRLEAEQAADQQARVQRAQRVDDLIQGFDASVREILSTVTAAAAQLDGTARDMTGIAEQTSVQASASAAASEQTSANVQTVAAAAEELAGSIQEIGRQVQDSAAITNQAVVEAERTNATVHGLAEAAGKIGAVIQLIQDIASQTNLLALNATIEAARAGEAGKGFAVVASEVKHLANQTASATEDIRLQIGDMQTATTDAVQAIAGIGGTIRRVSEIAGTIAAAVEEQAAATAEISRNVQQAAIGSQQVSSNVIQLNEAAGQGGAAADQVMGASNALNRQADLLREQIETFLASIRAA